MRETLVRREAQFQRLDDGVLVIVQRALVVTIMEIAEETGLAPWMVAESFSRLARRGEIYPRVSVYPWMEWLVTR